MDKHQIWAGLILILGILFFGFLFYVNQNPFTFRFEMDDNARAVAEKALANQIPSYNPYDDCRNFNVFLNCGVNETRNDYVTSMSDNLSIDQIFAILIEKCNGGGSLIVQPVYCR